MTAISTHPRRSARSSAPRRITSTRWSLIGHDGADAPRCSSEIDAALDAHGLIKVRVFSDDRAAREALLAELADALGAAPIQHIGKLLVLWRPPAAQGEGASARTACPGPKIVKVLKFSKSGNHRPQVKKVKVLGNMRLAAGGSSSARASGAREHQEVGAAAVASRSARAAPVSRHASAATARTSATKNAAATPCSTANDSRPAPRAPAAIIGCERESGRRRCRRARRARARISPLKRRAAPPAASRVASCRREHEQDQRRRARPSVRPPARTAAPRRGRHRRAAASRTAAGAATKPTHGEQPAHSAGEPGRGAAQRGAHALTRSARR